MRRSLLILTLALIFLSSPFYPYTTAVDDQMPKAPKAYRTVTHLHTSFSHDAKFRSEPNLQLENLKDQGYQVVLVSEHDHSSMGPAQTDFVIPPFKNGGFEVGKDYPNQWSLTRFPRESAEYLNVIDSSLSFEGNRSFHLRLTGYEDDFDLLSWAYRERGEDRIHDRPVAYNLLLRFSLYFPEPTESSDSVAYICSTLGRRGDLRYGGVSNRLCFYFAGESWDGRKFFDLSNYTRQVSIRLDPPTSMEWKTYSINLTDYALRFFDGLEDVPTKYLFLKQVTLNLASRREVAVDIYVDDFQVFSGWTSAEMYDWWRRDIESYSDDDFLVIAGLETTHRPDIGAYGLEVWHDFSAYNSVEARVKKIQASRAISALVNPRASNFTRVKEGGGWGTELIEIYNTAQDSKPSSQVIKAWDEFLFQGVVIFGVAGFDSHGLKAIPGLEQPTVVSQPLYENLIIAESLSRDDILSSLREGRVYVVRSDPPIRISFSAGMDGLQQGGGIVYTSPETGAVLNIYLEGITLGSELIIIQDGSRALEIGLAEDVFHEEIRLPLTDKTSYFRFEVRHLGDRVAFSNPLIFQEAPLPRSVWLALDPVLSLSKITSVQVHDGQIEVRLESPELSSAILKIHSPFRPNTVNINGNDYTDYEVPTIQDLVKMSYGWNYRSGSQMLTLKLTTEGSASVTIEFPEEISKDSKPFVFPLLEIGAVSAGLGLILLFTLYFRHRSLTHSGGRKQ